MNSIPHSFRAVTTQHGRGVFPPFGPTPLVGFPPPGLRGRPRPWAATGREKEEACTRRAAQTMASPQAVAAFGHTWARGLVWANHW